MSQANQNKFNLYARFSSIGIQMFTIIAIGSFSGVKLDEVYPNTNKLYTLIFSLSAVITSLIYGIRRIIAVSKDAK